MYYQIFGIQKKTFLVHGAGPMICDDIPLSIYIVPGSGSTSRA